MLGKLVRMFTSKDGDAKGPSLDSILEPLDAHLKNFDTLVLPAPESKPRTPFDSGLPRKELSTANFTPKQVAKLLPVMAPLMLGMQKSAGMYDGKFQPTKSEATPEFIAELERTAKASGVSDVAYVKVPNNAIFKDKGIPHPYAVVFTVEMAKEPISTSLSYESFHEVAKGYKNLAVISNKLAKKMRKEGFGAYPGTALGGITDYPTWLNSRGSALSGITAF